MEAFALLKFWKSNNAKVAAGTPAFDGGDVAETTAADSIISDPLTDESDEEDDDDSFFELELTMPNYDDSSNKSPNPNLSSSNNKLNQEREKSEFEPNPKPSSKPQSPISILRSAPPKLRVFMFGKLNRKPKLDEFSRFETESVSSSTNKNINNNNNLFTVKFKIEDGSIVPKFTRTNSSNHLPSPKPHHQQLKRQSSDEYYESQQQSKRFSKDVVQKYLNRIKPLYAKSSKRSGETESFAAASPTRSTASFPSPRKEKEEKEKQSSRFKAKCKQLGKSKSASAMIGAPSPASFPARNDHPVDGIEGAILHCKRSLNSSRGHSSLSRCSSDPSPEKSIQVSEIQRKKTDISACL